MQAINRKSKEVILNGGRSVQRTYISIESNRRLYFARAAALLCGIELGLYIHFLNDGHVWRFYINDDPDGFKITPVNSKGGFHISSSGLVNMILKSWNLDLRHNKRVAVCKTNIIHDHLEVFELSLENVSTVVR
jgi:hypothetical protein